LAAERLSSDRTSKWRLRALCSTYLWGHKDDSWSFPHFDTITVSVADAPRRDEILVVMAIADGAAAETGM
jgi:hypothetical protein